jgi:hypothetical protein
MTFPKMTVRTWSIFLVHQALGAIGVPIFSAVVVFWILPSREAHRILTETPYFPVQILFALILAAAVAQFLSPRLMAWVWILPGVVLFLSIAFSQVPLPSRLGHFFGWGCRPENRCFVQLAVTLPFYTSASYSLGAYLSGRVRMTKMIVRSP